MRRIALMLSATLIAVCAGVPVLLAQEREKSVSDEQIRLVELPLKLPAVGNVDAVKKWHFGRLQSVEQHGAGPDIVLNIRTADDVVHRIIGPAPPLGELARRSNWMTAPDAARPGRATYVERMIAFDADENGRLIAMMSMEPMNRARSRLRRALD
jgi:hypothetical protein